MSGIDFSMRAEGDIWVEKTVVNFIGPAGTLTFDFADFQRLLRELADQHGVVYEWKSNDGTRT